MRTKCFLSITSTIFAMALMPSQVAQATPSEQDEPVEISTGPTGNDPFPNAEPQSVGIPADALGQLVREVQERIDNDELIGAELVVIKNRRTVLRKAFGWKDQEAGEALEIDAVYCVRSMTKPVVGTAIQMLIDDGRLALDTPVHEILPSFAGPQTKTITVHHLLTHTSGLPLTTFTRPLADYADLAEVAAEAAATELLFEPGSRFEYSDAGSDTLGAIVAAITQMPVEQFIQQRILDPLGMRDTVLLLGNNNTIKARIPSAYSGGTGAWSKHWDPSDPPIFPLFLTSQSLYSTTTDYARFLALWMDGGAFEGQQLISTSAVKRALTPDQAMTNYPTTFDGVDTYYGLQWMVRTRTAGAQATRRTIFGHDGSDGTHAWVWPELDLMVLFFTQSRGMFAGLGLENEVQALLVDQRLKDSTLASSDPDSGNLQELAGLYWDEEVGHAYYVVTPRGSNIVLRRPGGKQMVVKPGDSSNRFLHEARPKIWIEFVRSADGEVIAMKTFFGKRIQHNLRHTPPEGLPSVDDVIKLVNSAHRVDELLRGGAIELTGKINYKSRKIKGTFVSWFDEARARIEMGIGGGQETIIVNGKQAWTANSVTGVNELKGRLREQILLDQHPVIFGDWRQYYEDVRVLKRVELLGQSVLLVRVVPREGPGSTLFVNETSGTVIRQDGLVQIPGIGIVGVQTLFEDFQTVGGGKIPFRTTSLFVTRLIGKVVTQIEKVRIGIDVPENAFAPPFPASEPKGY